MTMVYARYRTHQAFNFSLPPIFNSAIHPNKTVFGANFWPKPFFGVILTTDKFFLVFTVHKQVPYLDGVFLDIHEG